MGLLSGSTGGNGLNQLFPSGLTVAVYVLAAMTAQQKPVQTCVAAYIFMFYSPTVTCCPHFCDAIPTFSMPHNRLSACYPVDIIPDTCRL